MYYVPVSVSEPRCSAVARETLGDVLSGWVCVAAGRKKGPWRELGLFHPPGSRQGELRDPDEDKGEPGAGGAGPTAAG